MVDEMFDLISQEERNMIEYSVNAYNYINECSTADLSYVLRHWIDDKKDLFNLLGKQLIVSKEITIEKPRETMLNDIGKIWNLYDRNHNYCGADSTIANFINNWYAMIMEKYSDIPDIDQRRLTDLLDQVTLLDNVYNGETFSIPLPDGKSFKISNGMKVMRILNKLSTIYGIKDFDYFCNKHSQILNDHCLKGKLCLSVHPLDFITMSDNECSWHSCMSWKENGGYRQGTVEMMNSPYVICAYLTSSEPMTINGHEWNNKKWRELFIVNRNIICGVKGYPYINRDLEREVLKMLKPLGEKYYGITYQDDMTYIYGETEEEVQMPANKSKNISICFNTDYMYNDFGCGHYLYLRDDLTYSLEINYSGIAQCMNCGKDFRDFDYEDYDCEDFEGEVVCPHIHERTRCCICNEHYNVDSGYWIDGDFYCPDCYYDYTDEDCEEHERHNTDDMTSFYIINAKEHKATVYNAYVYGSTEDLIDFFKNNNKPLYQFQYEIGSSLIYGIDQKDLTDEEYLEWFGISSESDYWWNYHSIKNIEIVS